MSNENLQTDQLRDPEFTLTKKEEKAARKLAGRVIKAASKGKDTAKVPLLNPIRGHLVYEAAQTFSGTGHSSEIYDRSRGIIRQTHPDLDFSRDRVESGKVRVVAGNEIGDSR